MKDERPALADLIAEKILRNRTVPITSATLRVQGEEGQTVSLDVVTAAGQHIEVSFTEGLEP